VHCRGDFLFSKNEKEAGGREKEKPGTKLATPFTKKPGYEIGDRKKEEKKRGGLQQDNAGYVSLGE